MGTVELLKNLSLLSFALAGVFAAAAVFLFFKLDIRGAVRILSGSAMKKDIEAYREQGLSSSKIRKMTNQKKKRNGKNSESQNSPKLQADQKNQKESAEKATEPLDFEDRTEMLEEGTMLLNDETENQQFIIINDEMSITSTELI